MDTLKQAHISLSRYLDNNSLALAQLYYISNFLYMATKIQNEVTFTGHYTLSNCGFKP